MGEEITSDDNTSEVETESDGSDEGEIMERHILYPGSNLSSHDCSVAILSIMHKHSLTYSAVTDILKLFSQSLPSPNSLPQTQHLLLKSYVNYKVETIVHRCCGYCSRLLSDDTSCTIAECQQACIPESSFITICLDQQLKTLFMGTIVVIINHQYS